MIMEKKAADRLAKYLKENMKVEYNPHLSPLVLTDKDKISVGELKKKRNCPVRMCLDGLKDTKNVFFKKSGEQWAFAFKKDSFN